MSKVFKKIALPLVLLIVLGVVLTGCSSQSDLPKIRLMEVTHSLFYTPQYVALELGFFEEEGLDTQLINGKGADKVMTSLISGEADIGFMGPEASIYIYNEERDDYAVNFAQLTQRDGSFLVGREKDDNFKWEDLEGAEVLGGRKGGMPEMTLEYVIKSHGLEIPEDVNVRTDVQFDVLAGAFVGGEGDYVSLFEPVATQLEIEGAGYVVASIGETAGYIPYTAYCATNTYIDENPEIIQKFTNALYRGMVWVQEHPTPEVAQVVQPQFPDTEIEVLESLIDRYKAQDSWKPDLIITEDGLNHLMDIMELAGELDKRADFDKIVTTEFAEEAMKNLQ